MMISSTISASSAKLRSNSSAMGTPFPGFLLALSLIHIYTLTLVQYPSPEAPNEYLWALFNGSVGAQEWGDFAPLKRSRELIELLAWCHRNGVIDSSTRLSLHPGASDLTEYELSNLIGSLQQTFPLPLQAVEEAALLRASVPGQVLLLVNVGVDPLRQHSQMNVHMTTGRTDALGYSGVRENLVLTLDPVSYTHLDVYKRQA